MTDYYFKCDSCGAMQEYDKQNPDIVPASVVINRKNKMYRLCDSCATLLLRWMEAGNGLHTRG